MTLLTTAEAEALAEGICAAIDVYAAAADNSMWHDADRARVGSDLHLLRSVERLLTGVATVDAALDVAHKAASDGLRRTAALYGVLPSGMYVQEGWWHYNAVRGIVHDHPDNPGRGWSEAMHRQCRPVYTLRPT